MRRSDRPVTFRLSLSGLKVPNHDCICVEKTRNGEEKGQGVGNNNRVM